MHHFGFHNETKMCLTGGSLLDDFDPRPAAAAAPPSSAAESSGVASSNLGLDLDFDPRGCSSLAANQRYTEHSRADPDRADGWPTDLGQVSGL